jgi:hypothetical protein
MKTLRTLALTTLMLVTSVTIAACGGGGDSTTSPTPNPDPGPKPVSSVQLSSAATTLEVGGTVTLAATTRDAQNNVLNGARHHVVVQRTANCHRERDRYCRGRCGRRCTRDRHQ